VASSTSETTELAWKLKRLTETHEMRQRKLQEEYREKSMTITDELQAEQSTVFEELRTAMNIPDEVWGDGKDWVLNIEDLSDGTVALVHEQDEARADDCQCPACQLRRSIMGSDDDDDSDGDEAPILH
jgi:hypothetical protein